MNNTAARQSRPRLDIFDGLRGHLLIGMLVAHLSFQNGLAWLGNFHHNRILVMYDAEFFVLIAGLLVGYLWVTVYKTEKARRKFVTSRLVTIYKYYILSALPFFGASVFGGAPIIENILGVLTMQTGGWYSDILPIYFVCFVLFFPFAAVSALNRPSLMFIASAAIYMASQFTELRGFFGSSGTFVAFDIAAWQFLFVCSILVGRHAMNAYQRIRQADARVIAVVLIILVIVSAVLRQNFIYPNPLDLSTSLKGNTPRMGLHPLFLMRIIFITAMISIVLIRDDLWFRSLHKLGHWYFRLGFIRNIGKYSIQMFVFHVYIMALYKIAFADASSMTKAGFAISWIAIFIAAPNFWVVYKQRTQA